MPFGLYRFPNPILLLRRKQKSVFKASLIILVSILLSRLLGVVRDRLFTTYFFGGREWQLDVYYAAFRIPDTLYQLLISSVIMAGFLPIFSQKLVRQSKTRAFNFALATIFGLIFVFSLIIAISFPFWPQLLNWLAPGFSLGQKKLLLQLTPYIVLAELILAASNLSVLILQTHNNFISPALSPLMYNLGIIFGIVVLSPHYQALGLAYGVVLGSLGHLFIQLPALIQVIDGKLNLRLSSWSEIKADVTRLFNPPLPNFLSIFLIQVQTNWLTRLASFLTMGSLSLINLANNLIQLPISVFALALGQAIFPKLALSKERMDQKRFIYLFEQAIQQTLFIVTPLLIIFIVLRLPLVRLILGSRHFSWRNTVLTAKIIEITLPIILAQSLSVTFQKVFLALGQSRFILVAQFFSTLTFVGLTLYLLPRQPTVLSLAWALSLAAVVKFFLAGWLLLKGNPLLRGAILNSLQTFIKITLVGGISLFLAWLSYRLGNLLFNPAYIISLFLIISLVSIVTAVSYIGFSYWLKINPLFSLAGQLDFFKLRSGVDKN